MKIFEEMGYTYQEHLKSGGEGEIHLIKGVDKLFVAKIFPKIDDASFRLLKNLSREAIPNTPKIYELFNHEDKTILIRDYIQGQTLYEHMKSDGPFEYAGAKQIILRICETLKALHNLKPHPIIYRDLKPENIIITPNNQVRLIDFGIARYYKKEATRDTILAGTKGYTAPEVLAGMQSDNRSDIYSMGLLLYELLTGKNLLEPPFQIRPVRESNPTHDKRLDFVIAKATDFNQTNRYNSVEEFEYYLDHLHKVGPKRVRKILLIASILLFCGALVFSSYRLLWPPAFWGYEEYDEIYDPDDNIIKEIDDKQPDRIIKETNIAYQVLLDLEFDNIEDENFIIPIRDLGSVYSIADGKLFVEKEICSVDFEFTRGMIAHYKIKGSLFSSVSIGPYSVNASSHMDCFFFGEEQQQDLAAFGLPLNGAQIKGDMEYIDILLYTPRVGNAVYVLVINDNRGQIAHSAYKVPQALNDFLFMDMSNFEYMDGGFLEIESIKVIEGPLRQYVADNFDIYEVHKQLLDGYFTRNISELPSLELEPVDTMPIG